MRIVLGTLALAFGVFFAVMEVWGTFEFLHADQKEINYIVLAGCGIAAAVALMPAWATLAWRGRRVLSIAVWFLFAASVCSVVLAALSRTGTSTDMAEARRETAGASRTLAVTNKKDADDAVRDAREALAKAQTALTDKATSKTCLDNCAAMLAGAVKSAEERLDKAEKNQAEAASKTVAPPEITKDPLSKRIARTIPGLTEEQVALFQPAVVPVLTSALSAVLIALGFFCIARPATSRTLSERLRDRFSRQQSVPASDPQPVALASEASGQFVQPIALPAPILTADDYAPARVRSDHDDLHVREAWRDYERLTDEGRAEPVELPAFLHALSRSGIELRVDGRDVYLVGARLAS